MRRRLEAAEDGGAALIMALVFVTAIGLVMVAVLNLATNSLMNATSLRYQRSVELSADSATNASVEWVRNACPHGGTASCSSLFTASASSPVRCMPSGVTSMTINSQSMSVWCSGSASSDTRYVDFYTCPATVTSGCGTSGTNSGNVIVHANVQFLDSNLDGTVSCGSTSTTSCGIAMTINYWEVTGANS